MTDSGAERAARRIVKDWFCEVNGGWHREICEQRVAAIIREETGTQWIPVRERLPEDGVSALIFAPEWEDMYLRFRVAWIDYDESPPAWICNGEQTEGITHWMPLPAAPDEGGTR